MTEEPSGENATSPESVANTSPKSLGLQDFIAAKVEAAQQPEPESKPVEEVPPEPEQPETVEPEQEEQPIEEEQETETNGIDWDSLEDEDFLQMVTKGEGKSRLLKRLGDLTSRAKAAEEKAAKLESAIQQPDPLQPQAPADNPYKDVTDISELADKSNQVDALIEATEDILFQNEHAGQDDIVYEEGGQQFTKGDIRKTLRQAQKAKKTFLPAQLQAIQAREQRAQARKNNAELAKSELSWMQGEDNEIRQQYEATVESPIFKAILEKVPEAEPVIEYLAAHAVNSRFGKKPEAPKKPSMKAEPPTPTVGSNAGSPPESYIQKEIDAIKAKESMTMADFTKLAELKAKLQKS